MLCNYSNFSIMYFLYQFLFFYYFRNLSELAITSAYDVTNGRLYQDLQLSLDSVDNRTTLPRGSLNHFHQSWRKRDTKQSRFPLCIVKGGERLQLY